MHDTIIRSFTWALGASITAAIAAIVVGLVQLAVGRKISPGWRAAMWSLVMIRLIVAMPASRLSAMNLLGHSTPPRISAPGHSDEVAVVMGIISNPNAAPRFANMNIEHPKFSPAFDWRIVPATVWMLVAMLLLLRVIVGNVWFHRRLLAMPICNDPRLLNLLESCRIKLSAPRVRLIETAAIPGPALFGLFKPTLLLPAGLSARLSDAELEFIFVHELIHARRRDLLIDWLLAPIVILHWFNPVAWLAARQLRIERELACDERVLANRSPEERAGYGQTILRIFEEFSASRSPILTAGMIDPRSSLRRRIHAIARPAKSSTRHTCMGLFALLAIGCATLTSAPPAATQPVAGADTSDDTLSGDLVVRVYDVRDLLVSIPGIDNAPQFNADLFHSKPVPPVAPEAPPSRQDMISNLIRKIESNVEPSSWRSVGLGTMSVDEKTDRLIIAQSQPNQAKVWQYLQQLRAQRGTQITVEARFFRGGDVLESTFKTWPTSTGYSRKPAGGNVAILNISPQQAANLLTNAQSNPDISIISAPRVTIFNGQRAYIEIATSRAYVKDLHPVTSTTEPARPDWPAAPGYAADVGTVDSGILLDVQATASADHKYISLTLKPQISNLLSMSTMRWPGSPPDRNDLTIQVPLIETSSANTTISIPDRGDVLLQMATHTDPHATTQSSRQSVYLLVRATIHESVEPDHKPAPLLSTRPATAP